MKILSSVSACAWLALPAAASFPSIVPTSSSAPASAPMASPEPAPRGTGSEVEPATTPGATRRALDAFTAPTLPLPPIVPRGMQAEGSASSAPAIPLHPALTDRFFLGLGAYSATSTSEARLDSPLGIGTVVDFEDTLGLDESTWAPQGLLRFRISERWRVELEHFQLDRDHTVTTTQDIEWGDESFPAGTQLTTSLDVSVTRLSFGYSFFKRQDKELGIGLGFHITDYDAELSASGGNSESGDLLAPLPVISLYGQVALTEQWALGGRLDAFKVEYDPYQGHIYSIGIDATWYPWRNFGMGFGWRGLEFEVKAERDDWDGEALSVFSGPIFFLALSL
jgi:hypothetical protein